METESWRTVLDAKVELGQTLRLQAFENLSSHDARRTADTAWTAPRLAKANGWQHSIRAATAANSGAGEEPRLASSETDNRKKTEELELAYHRAEQATEEVEL